ncbi:helix-turn-helix domain-containing protein [Streptomyces smyrnaeus]|uniref:helix-turn-helix domain-containing protein n=1 Tax=Streptomyces smyrnaeus TaxID=1387713 RepID=UPI0036906FF0
MTALSPGEVRALPALPTVQQAFDAFGISRDTGYALINSDEFPIQVVRLGRLMKVRRTDLLAFLGMEDDVAEAATSATSGERSTASTSK